ncbi:GNAT family N-acetyltransferase [Microbulbifer agarilyticus]|uniref:GNAT family N-acetyltransferase n=1 Tax=Microbulbifer agarilyticus TaxID=260552 RepID=UPI0021BBBB61|nr:GNAT family N-acetyltransferase [Microbulbifer agarilyticus]
MSSSPVPTITTERLRLRQLTDSDADAQFTLELLNDPDFHRYIGDRGVRTLEDARQYILRGPIAMYASHGLGMYCVELKDGTPIGQSGLMRRAELDNVEVGFAYLPQYRGQGYALEAATAAMQWGKESLGLTRILAIATPENHASIKLLEKLGLSKEDVFIFPETNEELALLAWNQKREPNKQ